MDSGDVLTEERMASDPARLRVGWVARLRTWIRPRRRWCLGTRLVVMATVVWVLFVAAHHLASGRTPLWAPIDLIPPFLFLAVPVALLVVAPLARPVRWRIIAVLVAVGVLGAGPSGINLATLWHTPPPAPPHAITVVSWNTEFWDQDWPTDRRDADFYGFLRELDADVYLLKEYLHARPAAAAGWTADMAIRLDELPRLRREFPDYQVAVAGEQITLSRFPVVQQKGLDLTPWLPAELRRVPVALREFPDSYRYETLRTDIDVDGTVISFYNTHVNQPPLDWRLHRDESRGGNQYNHTRRAASYRALREDIAGNENPVMVGADLNTTPAMGALRLLPEELVDQTRALSSFYPASWRAGELRLWRIDWVFTTPDVAVHEYAMSDAEGLSDHLPQRVVLSVDG